MTIEGRRHNGFLLDFSRTGLFIQTSATPSPGDRLDIEVSIRGKKLSMHVEVARRKQVPPQLLTVAHGGIGVRILSAPEEYYQLLVDAQAKEGGAAGPTRPVFSGGSRRPRAARASPTPVSPGPEARTRTDPEPAPAGKQFRVRVKQVKGTRTRTLRIHAADESAVRREVCDDLGDEWKILEVEAL